MSNKDKLSDPELIPLIEKGECFELVYKRCRKYSLGFMAKNFKNAIGISFDKTYHEATIVLYEKIAKGGFKLINEASFQTYLNSVCKNILLKKLKSKKKTVSYEDNIEVKSEFSYDEQITDFLDEVEAPKEKLIKALETALEKMKQAGGKCYQIIMMFYYEKQSMTEIATTFNYTNADNVKNQKSRCMKKLRKRYNEINA